MCAKFGASTLPRYRDIARKKMGAEICLQAAAGGWHGGPAAAGLSIFNRIPLRPDRVTYFCYLESSIYKFDLRSDQVKVTWRHR